jgi:CRISPR type III-A-associated RAMP protein Csm5
MKVKIETLTPVHIGSGNFLQNNTEYFTVVTTSGKRYVRIVDERKILDLIGKEHLQNWLLSIERRQNIKEFIKVYAPNAKPADYSRRKMILFCNVEDGDTLKECIHNGMGLPYIPGSSIKGALRTAITEIVANKKENLDTIARVKKYRKGQLVEEYDGGAVEKYLFGHDANQDIFRFLQCGDAYFPAGKEVVFRLQMYLNITHSDTLIPQENTKPQLIEALGQGAESVFQLKLNTESYKKIFAKQPSAVGQLPEEMNSIEKLFATVNIHTYSLVKREIDFWTDQDRTGAELYIEQMKKLADGIQFEIANGNKSCILRIGHASGWDFITGGWARNLEDFQDVRYAARPGESHFLEYAFPKSRRLDTDGEIIGFVKLSMQ